MKNSIKWKSEKHFINWCFLCARHSAQNIIRDKKAFDKKWQFGYLDENYDVAEFIRKENEENVYEVYSNISLEFKQKYLDIISDIIYSSLDKLEIADKHKVSRKTVYLILSRFRNIMKEHV